MKTNKKILVLCLAMLFIFGMCSGCSKTSLTRKEDSDNAEITPIITEAPVETTEPIESPEPTESIAPDEQYTVDEVGVADEDVFLDLDGDVNKQILDALFVSYQLTSEVGTPYEKTLVLPVGKADGRLTGEFGDGDVFVVHSGVTDDGTQNNREELNRVSFSIEHVTPDLVTENVSVLAELVSIRTDKYNYDGWMYDTLEDARTSVASVFTEQNNFKILSQSCEDIDKKTVRNEVTAVSLTDSNEIMRVCLYVSEIEKNKFVSVLVTAKYAVLGEAPEEGYLEKYIADSAHTLAYNSALYAYGMNLYLD